LKRYGNLIHDIADPETIKLALHQAAIGKRHRKSVNRFYRDHVTLRRKLALRIRRKAAKVGRKDRLTYNDAASMISYWGWLKHTNSYGFYHKYVKPNCSIKKAKEIVKHENNLRNRTD